MAHLAPYFAFNDTLCMLLLLACSSLSGLLDQGSRPTHRDKVAMNGAQTSLFVKRKPLAGSVNWATCVVAQGSRFVRVNSLPYSSCTERAEFHARA